MQVIRCDRCKKEIPADSPYWGGVANRDGLIENDAMWVELSFRGDAHDGRRYRHFNPQRFELCQDCVIPFLQEKLRGLKRETALLRAAETRP